MSVDYEEVLKAVVGDKLDRVEEEGIGEEVWTEIIRRNKVWTDSNRRWIGTAEGLERKVRVRQEEEEEEWEDFDRREVIKEIEELRSNKRRMEDALWGIEELLPEGEGRYKQQVQSRRRRMEEMHKVGMRRYRAHLMSLKGHGEEL